jgi:hypothetical protein
MFVMITQRKKPGTLGQKQPEQQKSNRKTELNRTELASYVQTVG